MTALIFIAEGIFIGIGLAYVWNQRPRRKAKPLAVFGADGWVYSEDGRKARYEGGTAGYFDFSSIETVSSNANVQLTVPEHLAKWREASEFSERPALRLVEPYESERALLDACTERKGCPSELHLSTCPEKPAS